MRGAISLESAPLSHRMGCAEGRWSEARRRGSDARSLCQPMPAILLAIGILANISSAGRAGAAVPCGEVALEIAMSSKLENRGLSKDGTFISPALSGAKATSGRLVCLCEQNQQCTNQTAPTGHQIGSRALRQRSVEVESPNRNIVCRFQRSLR